MTRRGYVLEALAFLLSAECYLRKQGWHQLRKEDVFSAKGQTSNVSGVRERGIKVKTGSNLGMTLDKAFVADALQAVADDIAEAEVVFPFTPAHYKKVW